MKQVLAGLLVTLLVTSSMALAESTVVLTGDGKQVVKQKVVKQKDIKQNVNSPKIPPPLCKPR